jgi:NADP-dependent 3-hydroxy acid dehydrogenase YdfG
LICLLTELDKETMMNSQQDLEGMSALVTGATSGIGEAVAEALGRLGE